MPPNIIPQKQSWASKKFLLRLIFKAGKTLFNLCYVLIRELTVILRNIHV